MKNNIIITIGREFGSGGKAIGKIVSEKLGIDFYDKEIISLAAKDSGMAPEVIENNDEKPMSSFFFSLALDARNTIGRIDSPISQQAFLAQFNVIKKIAAEGKPCVFVGRCADYALASFENVVSVFINADMEDKIALVSELRSLTKDKAIDLINKTNKTRANYYNYYSSKKWGAASSYDLCINSSRTGYEGAAELIIRLAEIKQRILDEK